MMGVSGEKAAAGKRRPTRQQQHERGGEREGAPEAARRHVDARGRAGETHMMAKAGSLVPTCCTRWFRGVVSSASRRLEETC